MLSLARSSSRVSSVGSRSSLSVEFGPPSSPRAPAPRITEAKSSNPTVKAALEVVSVVELGISSMRCAQILVISIDSEHVHSSL